jgi:hypothetical protein
MGLLFCSLTSSSLPAAPVSPRELFNSGTAELLQGKLRESEASLESALATQSDAIQAPSLYNLGFVRFQLGGEELKKAPPAAPTLARSQNASEGAARALNQADAALAGGEVDHMVASYLAGRGARKELKAAAAAVERALGSYRATLLKWQRASDDFKSAAQLNPADQEAKANAQTADEAIAKLVDKLQRMQEMAAAMGAQSKQLGQKLQQLKGRIPSPNMPPGAPGDEDEDDDKQPNGQEPGLKEGSSKDGQEMSLTPEQAGWLLEGFKLDSERRLPMGDKDTPTRKRSGATW